MNDMASKPQKTGQQEQNEIMFRLEEYRMLRNEIESYSKQKRQLEISLVTALIGIYGWLTIAQLEPYIRNLILTIPFILIILGILRYRYYHFVIKIEVAYVKDVIEKYFLTIGGWEAFWENQQQYIRLYNLEWKNITTQPIKEKTYRYWNLLFYSEIIFWITIISFSIWATIILYQ